MTEPLPKTMTVVEISEPGDPDVLKTAARAVPQVEEGHVLIQVAYAGVNRPDVMQRKGMYPPPPGAPDFPGLEVSGRIAAIGDNVRGFAEGDEVCALVAGGGYAQYCLAPAAQCLPIPANLSLKEAAGLPETFFTVWTNMMDRGRLQQGETVLIHGGSSGIGTTGIQMAVAWGARVLVTAGTGEKCQACEDLGAVRAINYKTEDFVEEVKKSTDGKGVDLILDMVGADYYERNVNCLAVEGRLVQIALQTGSKTNMDLLPIMIRRLTVTGSTLRPRSIEQKGEIASALRRHIWPLIEKGKIQPIIYKSFPLSDAAGAHALMESSTHIGKILLEV